MVDHAIKMQPAMLYILLNTHTYSKHYYLIIHTVHMYKNIILHQRICIIYSIEGRLICQIADQSPRAFRYWKRLRAEVGYLAYQPPFYAIYYMSDGCDVTAHHYRENCQFPPRGQVDIPYTVCVEMFAIRNFRELPAEQNFRVFIFANACSVSFWVARTAAACTAFELQLSLPPTGLKKCSIVFDMSVRKHRMY